MQVLICNIYYIYVSVEKLEDLLITLSVTDIPADIKEKLLDYVERYAITLLYRIFFCPPFTSDEEKELVIQKRFISYVKKAD